MVSVGAVRDTGEGVSQVLIEWNTTEALFSPSEMTPPSLIVTLLVDVTLSEEHDRAAELTDSPIEDGSVITDHRRVGPRALKMRGIVTDSPLEVPRVPSATFIARTEQEVRDLAQQDRDQLQAPRAHDAYQQLQAGFEAKSLVRITTEQFVFDNMGWLTLSVKRDPATGRALDFEASFREVFLASTEITFVKTDVKSSVPPKTLGQKGTTPVDGKKIPTTTLRDVFGHDAIMGPPPP